MSTPVFLQKREEVRTKYQQPVKEIRQLPEDRIIDALDTGSRYLLLFLTVTGVPYLLFLIFEAMVRLP
ncbi:hypothetical protein CR205_01950 [Alteribacter lacisalsi]|uniref:Uncharacterized protein n=1 Tax=Alteribacter lacisalsi TaxID=2045244 RepID=A0A2W0HKK7_9BACI|nr:hypothetical protein [Alteribacter lacisalsi]PYZ97389.1 hypothetical protein CR205_01950 [Alteribacter lacisalsi]